jgi:cyclophilin family peptidyl-prolyl cis-trans isomerase
MVYVHSQRSHRITEPFEDEIHPRLRFGHRGIVAMANNGMKNSNDSQFFITLGVKYSFTLMVEDLDK